MEIWDAFQIISVGFVAGFINTLAGGGSLLTLPLLIFFGLTANEANATNRVALFIQNIFAIKGFKSKGIAVFPYSYWVGLSACVGAVFGSLIAVDLDPKIFNKILVLVMVMVIIISIFKSSLIAKNSIANPFDRKKNTKSIVAFFFVGIYGGFIQVGVGFIIIAVLSLIHGLKMTTINSIKVFIIFSYTLVALIIFILNDLVNWHYGLVLAIGNALGAWFTSRWSVKIPDLWVRIFLWICVSILSVKLWFF